MSQNDKEKSNNQLKVFVSASLSVSFPKYEYCVPKVGGQNHPIMSCLITI